MHNHDANPGPLTYHLTNGHTIRFELNDGDPEIEFRYPNGLTRICGPENLAPLRDWLVAHVR